MDRADLSLTESWTIKSYLYSFKSLFHLSKLLSEAEHSIGESMHQRHQNSKSSSNAANKQHDIVLTHVKTNPTCVRQRVAFSNLHRTFCSSLQVLHTGDHELYFLYCFFVSPDSKQVHDTSTHQPRVCVCVCHCRWLSPSVRPVSSPPQTLLCFISGGLKCSARSDSCSNSYAHFQRADVFTGASHAFFPQGDAFPPRA